MFKMLTKAQIEDLHVNKIGLLFYLLSQAAMHMVLERVVCARRIFI